LQKKFCWKVLIATVQAHRPLVSPEELVRTLRAKHNIRRRDVLIEVCVSPADFFITIRSTGDLNHVVEYSVVVCCGGAPMSFTRWGEDHGAKPYAPLFLAKLSFDGLPRESWNPESLTEQLNDMDGQLVRVNPSSDSWSMEVMAWMQEISSLRVPKIVDVDVPALVSKVTEGSAAAAATTFCRHQVIVHVQEVRVHHRTPCSLPVASIDDNQDMVDHHNYHTWAGRVDGMGSPPFREGG
jgi:hypothetical protein